MRAESEGEGRGATFTVFLPVQEAQQTDSRTPTTTGRTHRRAIFLNDVHVLIVDDRADARELLRAMLTPTGARLSEASSAEQALKLIAADPPDLMLADVAMPRRDGYSLIRELRDRPEGRRIRAIAVSAYARGTDKKRALAEGFDGHVSKPVDPQELWAAVEDLGLGGAERVADGSNSAVG